MLGGVVLNDERAAGRCGREEGNEEEEETGQEEKGEGQYTPFERRPDPRSC